MSLYLAHQTDVQAAAFVNTRMQLQYAQGEARRYRLEGRAQFHHGGAAGRFRALANR